MKSPFTPRVRRGLASAGAVAAIALVVPRALADEKPQAVPRAIVKVNAIHTHPDPASPWQKLSPHGITGSAVVIGGHRILTNAHVVEDATLVEVQTERSSRTYTAEIVAVAHAVDLALLTVKDPAFFEGIAPLEIGSLPQLRSKVVVFGYPEGGAGVSVTSGVVSRIEVEEYVYSKEHLLRGQIDAAVNPGNSGGPVVGAGGRIVGIAMQVRQGAENVGYMVPAPVVRHFLADIEDGRLDGVPDLGVYFQPVENPSLRRAFGLDDDASGVVVVGVAKNGPAAGHLQVGDVLTAYDGHAIDRDGDVTLGDGFRVEATFLEQSKQIGETLAVRVVRAGEPHEERIAMTPRRSFVMPKTEDGAPRWFVYGGVVFQPLSASAVRRFRRPPPFAYLALEEFTPGPWSSFVSDAGAGAARDEAVTITTVLADELTRGYQDFAGATVWSVDDHVVRDFSDLVATIENGRAPFVRIVTASGSLLVLEREAVRARQPLILARYGVHADRSPGIAAAPSSAPLAPHAGTSPRTSAVPAGRAD